MFASWSCLNYPCGYLMDLELLERRTRAKAARKSTPSSHRQHLLHRYSQTLRIFLIFLNYDLSGLQDISSKFRGKRIPPQPHNSSLIPALHCNGYMDGNENKIRSGTMASAQARDTKCKSILRPWRFYSLMNIDDGHFLSRTEPCRN